MFFKHYSKLNQARKDKVGVAYKDQYILRREAFSGGDIFR